MVNPTLKDSQYEPRKENNLGTNNRELHIVGGITKQEAERLVPLFGANNARWIKPDVKSLQQAERCGHALLIKRGQHHSAVLHLPKGRWYIYDRLGNQLIVEEKVPGQVKFERKFEITLPAAPPPPIIA